MKSISLLALVLALVGAGGSIWGMIEKDGYDKNQADFKNFAEAKDAQNKNRAQQASDNMAADAKNITISHYLAWTAGGLGALLGLVAIGQKSRTFGLVALLLGLAAVGASFLSLVQGTA